ncbi:MAG TPA: DUF2950 family protein [Bacteroidota bacterium]
MAAQEMFESFIAALQERDREALRELIGARRGDMLAARSEESRVRVADEFIREVRASMKVQKK